MMQPSINKNLSSDRSQLLAAYNLHASGRLAEAEVAYREILKSEPKSFEPRQLLAALLIQTDRAAEAFPILVSLRLENPRSVQVLTNLGTAYSRLGDPLRASQCYEEALAIDSHDIGTRSNLATSLIKQKRYEDAERQLLICLESEPDREAWLLSLASCQNKLQRFEDAKKSFRRILEVRPDHLYALAGLGQVLLKKSEDAIEAASCWQKLVESDSSNPAYWNNFASALRMAKRYLDAEQACLRALEILPDFFQAKFNLGMILISMARLDEARTWLCEAIKYETKRFEPHQSPCIHPRHAEYAKVDDDLWIEYGAMAYNQLAIVENALGNTDRAWSNLKKCLDLRPDFADAELMQAFLHLQVGDFDKGWPLYESRCKGIYAPRQFSIPRWDGTTHPGKTLLIHAEQGFGDSMMFIRYAALAKERVGKVLFLSHKPLANLMRTCRSVDAVIADGEPLPAYDFHIPLMSLPGIFKSTLGTIPRSVPYLHIPDELVEYWGERMNYLTGFRVGIAWQGNPEFANDQFRSVPLSYFRPIAEIPGVQLISLQQGYGVEQLDSVDFSVQQLGDVDKRSGAFMDTAAIMKNLDLVISSDTAIPHLAGALGVQVWLAKSFVCEWRWLASDQPDNPWYPSMTMFRQSRIGDWLSVFNRMRSKIESFVEQDHLKARTQ